MFLYMDTDLERNGLGRKSAIVSCNEVLHRGMIICVSSQTLEYDLNSYQSTIFYGLLYNTYSHHLNSCGTPVRNCKEKTD